MPRRRWPAAAALGRPLEFSPKKASLIVKALQLGNTVAAAAAVAGIGRSTVYSWIRRGERGEEPFADFLDSVKKARGVAEARAVAEIYMAAERGEWQAAAWLLERKHPDRWGRVPAGSASHAAPESPARSAAIAELYTACATSKAPSAGLMISFVGDALAAENLDPRGPG